MKRIQKRTQYVAGDFHKRKKAMLAVWELKELTAGLKRNDWNTRATAKDMGINWNTFVKLIKEHGFITRCGVVLKEEPK